MIFFNEASQMARIILCQQKHSLNRVYNNFILLLTNIFSPAGTVAARLPRHVQAAAWRDTAVHSASIRTGRITPGCAGQTSPWRITLACTEEWLDLLLPETGQWTLLQGVKCLPDMAERERSSFSTDCDRV